MSRITSLEVSDIRFPTSRALDGSDAMNPAPDYSAAYVVLRTDEGPNGHGFAFTIGRGNDLQCSAIRLLTEQVVGLATEKVCGDLGEFSRRMSADSQWRWLGPEKGVLHMAIGAVVNAAWDLASKRAGKPVWQMLAEMSPEELVNLVDWRYLSDALTPDEALELLRDAEPGRAERARQLHKMGYPAYATSPGWLGYDDMKLARLCGQAIADGFDMIKLKVGSDPEDDLRRLRVASEATGPGVRIALDANQCWDVEEAIRWMQRLAPFEPWWIEEPTSPDDVLGHAMIRRAVSPIRVATGEHVHNRVMFKQLLQAEAIDVLQLDATRVAGINENVAVLLLAAKFGVPVCPHAGGVGLCELVQHLSMFDYVAVSGSMDDRVIEYVDHLHEHFVSPVRMSGSRYLLPQEPGTSAEIREESQNRFRYPGGQEWQRSC